MIDVSSFWPFYVAKTGPVRFDYADPTGSMPPITSVFSWDVGSNSLLLTDFDAHLNWKDQWFMQVRDNQVVEYADKYPGGKTVNMDGLLGAPIQWGGIQNIGDTLVTYPKMNPVKSWPPALSSGIQIVVFESMLPTLNVETPLSVKTYNNVLQFTYLQSWSGGPGTGARYWMADGVGPVQLQWIAQDPADPTRQKLIETKPMYAEVTGVTALVS